MLCWYCEGLGRELLIKFRDERLSYEEALELQGLLEEQKKRHEEAGNITVAFYVLTILILLLAHIASLVTSGKRKARTEPIRPR
jgi:hypothetical protein